MSMEAGRRIRGTLVAVGLLVSLSPERVVQAASAAGLPVARFAIVIGNNRAEYDRTENLRYADDDAVALDRLLRQAGVETRLFTTMDRDTQRLYPDGRPAGPPRAGPVEAGLSELFARMRLAADRGVTTELMFFYSGHGDVAGGEGYVLLEDRRVTRADFREWMSRSPAARNHVFIDACRSFFLLFSKKAGGRRVPHQVPLVLEPEAVELANVGYILSTASDRESHEWDAIQGGILSHELRSALRGGADADLDGRVTYAELGAFLRTANEKIINPAFRPDFLIHPPGGDLDGEVLSWDAKDAPITADLGAVGHVFVEDARGVRLLDAHPASAQTLHLHLPPERPLFICEQDGRREYALASSERVTSTALRRPPEGEATRPKGASREALALKELFETAFDASDVELYVREEDAARSAEDASRDHWRRNHLLRLATGGVALGAAAAGLTFSTLALDRYLSGAGTSQLERDRLNHDVARLNIASLVCYGVAAAAGVGWAALSVNAPEAYSVSVDVDPGHQLAFTFGRRF
jgi:hypothetical protein